MGKFYETLTEEVEKINQARIKACPMLKKDGVDWSVCNDVRVGGECLNCQKRDGPSGKKENTDYLTNIIRKLEDLLNGVLVHYHDEERLKIIIELYNFLDRKWGEKKR